MKRLSPKLALLFPLAFLLCWHVLSAESRHNGSTPNRDVAPEELFAQGKDEVSFLLLNTQNKTPSLILHNKGLSAPASSMVKKVALQKIRQKMDPSDPRWTLSLKAMESSQSEVGLRLSFVGIRLVKTQHPDILKIILVGQATEDTVPVPIRLSELKSGNPVTIEFTKTKINTFGEISTHTKMTLQYQPGKTKGEPLSINQVETEITLNAKTLGRTLYSLPDSGKLFNLRGVSTNSLPYRITPDEVE